MVFFSPFSNYWTAQKKQEQYLSVRSLLNEVKQQNSWTSQHKVGCFGGMAEGR